MNEENRSQLIHVRSILRREWICALVIALLVTAILQIPYALGYAFAFFPTFIVLGVWGKMRGSIARSCIYRFQRAIRAVGRRGNGDVVFARDQN